MKNLLINEAIKKSLDDLAKLEMFNSYLYHQLSATCQAYGFFGASKKYNAEALEEVKHYQDVVDFINQRGGLVEAQPISIPVFAYETLGDTLRSAYDQEVLTENAYKELGSLALSVSDHVTYQFVHEVLEHQAESVGEYADLIARYELTQGDPSAILLIDQELGTI